MVLPTSVLNWSGASLLDCIENHSQIVYTTHFDGLADTNGLQLFFLSFVCCFCHSHLEMERPGDWYRYWYG